MKFSLIAAVVVLALAQGSFAQDASDLEKLTTYFEEVKNTMTAKMTELMNHQDVANHADNIRTQLEPLTAKLRETVTNLQAQAQPVMENIQAQAQPMMENIQAQAQPVVENLQKQMEAILQKLQEQAKALTQ
ncbi:type-4 ice-structuring protein LS-12-like [Acanthochromis polyacanthus]|uniref:type-4 ice-structuring protein LS-12-like n=1 Tax=Acanthochromis polyacanthus TaxID=80966 RepID=UPI000B8FE81C|nr:type-4 ice-structuring protein LS-12-like [Acanthochromis polyacanthus]